MTHWKFTQPGLALFLVLSLTNVNEARADSDRGGFGGGLAYLNWDDSHDWMVEITRRDGGFSWSAGGSLTSFFRLFSPSSYQPPYRVSAEVEFKYALLGFLRVGFGGYMLKRYGSGFAPLVGFDVGPLEVTYVPRTVLGNYRTQLLRISLLFG